MRLFIAVIVLSFAAVARANVTLPDVISSGMVLQRDQVVPIWGTADPGESVTVNFKGQTRNTTADANGRWLIRLKGLKAASSPSVLIIESNSHCLTRISRSPNRHCLIALQHHAAADNVGQRHVRPRHSTERQNQNYES